MLEMFFICLRPLFAWELPSLRATQGMSQQPELHVGPGRLWSCQPLRGDGHGVWWDVLGQEHPDDPKLDYDYVRCFDVWKIFGSPCQSVVMDT